MELAVRVASAKEAYFVRPDVKITKSTVDNLIRAGVDPDVARLDLEAVKLVLQENTGWNDRRLVVAELEYKRFLTLHLWNRQLSHPLVPTRLIDEVWHAHILDTCAYRDDTRALFGEYLHHFPYLGIANEESRRLKAVAFELFCELYLWTFGESHLQSLLRLDEDAC